MGMFGIPNPFRSSQSKPEPKPEPKAAPKQGRSVLASFDSAETTVHNYRHWAKADDLSPDASLSPEKRRILRNRSRYELVQNSAIGRGMVKTFAQDTIGTSIKMVMGLPNEAHNQQVQSAFGEWLEAISLVPRLLTAKTSKTIDGEMMFRLVTNTRLDHEIQLDLLALQADHLSSPHIINDLRPGYVDGVHLDRLKNPIAYDLLTEHPGSTYSTPYGHYQTYDASQVIHWFTADQCGQHRGMPECAPALPLFAYRRRYVLAVIAAAETAANRSTVLKTTLDLEDIDEELAAASVEFAKTNLMRGVHLDRNEATVLPAGFDLTQQQAIQPTNTFTAFDQSIVMELSRCLMQPTEAVTGNYAALSYSGGLLSRANYERGLDIERGNIKRTILKRLFSAWMHEAALTSNVLPSSLADTVLDIARKVGPTAIARKIPHEFYFDAHTTPDPKKAAEAAAIRLRNALTTRSQELAKLGIDIDQMDMVGAREAGFGDDVSAFRRAVSTAILANGNLSFGSGDEIIDKLDEIESTPPMEALAV